MKRLCQFAIRKIARPVVGLIVIFVCGCSTTTPELTQMVSKDVIVEHTHSHSLSVDVKGGELEESHLIRNEDFKKAIETSLGESKVVFPILQNGNSEFQLDVFIGDLKQQMFGGAFTAEMDVIWNLSNQKTGKTVWQKLVKSKHTATTDEDWRAASRLRLSTEGAAQANIKKGIEFLSQIPSLESL